MGNCAECGHELQISKGPNRFRSYRGQPGYLIPHDLEFEECLNCGARWMDDRQIDILSDALELQRKARMPQILIKKLRSDAVLPKYQSPGASGVDLHACLEEPVILMAGERKLVRTGLAMAIPKGYEGQVRPRSGLALRVGLSCVNSPGTIDADYRGEIGVILINLGQEMFKIEHGDRIAQLVICPVYQAEMTEVDDLDETLRGAGGYGSTGR